MSAWNDLLEKINSTPNPIDRVRRNCLLELSKKTNRNVIIYYSGWLSKPDSDVPTHINDEDKNGFMAVTRDLDRTKGLDLVLHTQGGDMAATESIIDYLKDCFSKDIDAIIPQIAMSGGTAIACACNKIVMGRQSSLGPIDPQISGMSAHAVINAFKIACQEMKADSHTIPAWQPILSNYRPSMIIDCRNAISWIKEIVAFNLKDSMLKGKTDEQIQDVVKKLEIPGITASHSRHLSAKYCKNIGLNIEMMENDQDLQDKILAVHHATMITLNQTSATKIIENHKGRAFIKSSNFTLKP